MGTFAKMQLTELLDRTCETGRSVLLLDLFQTCFKMKNNEYSAL